MQTFRRPHYQQFALWLAIAAVLLRALIPDGFMPEHRAGQRGLVLAFCSAGPLAGLRARQSSSLAEARQLADGRDPANPGHPAGDTHLGCPFASAAAPGLPAAPVAILSTPFGAAAPLRFLAVSVAFAVFRIRPPSRAPPRYS